MWIPRRQLKQAALATHVARDRTRSHRVGYIELVHKHMLHRKQNTALRPEDAQKLSRAYINPVEDVHRALQRRTRAADQHGHVVLVSSAVGARIGG